MEELTVDCSAQPRSVYLHFSPSLYNNNHVIFSLFSRIKRDCSLLLTGLSLVTPLNITRPKLAIKIKIIFMKGGSARNYTYPENAHESDNNSRKQRISSLLGGSTSSSGGWEKSHPDQHKSISAA